MRENCLPRLHRKASQTGVENRTRFSDVEKIFSLCCRRSNRKWKGGDHHEEVCQAEAEVFGPPEAGYQVQFLNRVVMTTSESKEAGLAFPNRLLALGNRTRKLPVQLCKTRTAIGVQTGALL